MERAALAVNLAEIVRTASPSYLNFRLHDLPFVRVLHGRAEEEVGLPFSWDTVYTCSSVLNCPQRISPWRYRES